MTFTDKEHIKNLEKVWSGVSSKYVPIKTTDFIKIFEPEFTFKRGRQYRQGSNAHYVELSKDSDINIYIENSFDTSLSLRVAFKYKDFVFGKVRQIHKGMPAIKLNEQQADIAELYSQASQTIDSLMTTEFSKEEMKSIATVALKVREKREENVRGINYNTTNALDFICTLLNDIKEGNLEYRSTSGWKYLKEVKSDLSIVEVSNAMWKVIHKKFPEFYI